MFLNPQIKLIYIGPAELPSTVIFILKLRFGDLERSRSTGVDLEIVLCGYNTIKMNSGDKFNVVIAFEISVVVLE